ncbi:MAG TPA: ABC transporter permease [Chitinophagaceae bacterium]|nr:ABC transporter permease [Chitinophagaceae bacterium]
MIRNYLKVALRNLQKSKLYSAINITGLATGMAVAMLIGLWVWDEMSFNKYHANYERIGQVWQFVKFDVEKAAYNSVPVPVAEELRTKYADVQSACVTTYNRSTILAAGDKKISRTGMYTEPAFPAMMTVKMLSGSKDALKDVNNVLVSASLAQALFGKDDPLNQVVRLNNQADVKVAGVYEDFPGNSSFKDVFFLSTWSLFTSVDNYAKRASTQWDENSFQVFVQLKPGSDFTKFSAAIRDMRMKRDDPPAYKPAFFVHPMKKWHLHGDFKNGENIGGLVQLVKIFGIAGLFVLLLACINFMNLSTARSEKRAKEVGIRKTIGSARSQLVYQFFSESILVSFIALLFCVVLVQLCLPFFNSIAGKTMALPWSSAAFWLIAIGFSLFTGLIAGSYPALYLSSFRPVKVLKGTFKTGRLAALPRKALVVFQFTVSVVLMIGTIIVFRQVQYAKDRPTGYNKEGLIEVSMATPDLFKNYNALQTDLLSSGAVRSMAQASTPITADYGGTTDISWKGKTGNTKPLFIANQVTLEYGNTIGWKMQQGRNFSPSFLTDSAAVVLNASAVQTMGFKNPLAEVVRISGKNYQVIGVVDDIIKFSPYDQVKPSFFTLNKNGASIIVLKIADQAGLGNALSKIESIFKKHNPAAPFEYKFVDDEYAAKFSTEVRIGKLAGFFAVLAIFISCLGLFGLASFVAEQRTKEIGIRKVLGASVLSLWRLLSKDFVMLVFISLLIASPIAYYFMHGWLENYNYRVSIAWWMFALAGGVAFLLTIVMVSFQAIKAALTNPVKSLKTE